MVTGCFSLHPEVRIRALKILSIALLHFQSVFLFFGSNCSFCDYFVKALFFPSGKSRRAGFFFFVVPRKLQSNFRRSVVHTFF